MLKFLTSTYKRGIVKFEYQPQPKETSHFKKVQKGQFMTKFHKYLRGYVCYIHQIYFIFCRIIRSNQQWKKFSDLISDFGCIWQNRLKSAKKSQKSKILTKKSHFLVMGCISCRLIIFQQKMSVVLLWYQGCWSFCSWQV